ncbi:hypothetical protein Anacy_4724 [Anabaena cylindrica PCC 7122]|uniref:Uncharacterized protein n=1 Tax=Anabaena cylindrica (strain ATCC 27899 / PCC 7122) TaxID=272123 RepID=K9ZP14_ANACC|nr:hypothetical protein Anacy_4724 [Anabaena cylindrica PCC 7122]BAY02866.1 hypothetical protein NIES19_21150 [Anabaena cylindrica PCC 7122]
MVLGGILYNHHQAKTIGTNGLGDRFSEIDDIDQDKTSTKACILLNKR